MKLKNRMITGSIVSGALLIGALVGAAPANATTAAVEGGTWNYGVSSGVFSNYYNPTRLHRATSCNGNGACARSADTRGGNWANSQIAKTSSGNGAYYYNY